jgi:hypothetical protein
MDEWRNDYGPKIKGLEKSTRVSYLLNFNKEETDLLVKKWLSVHLDNPDTQWVVNLGYTRVRQNCNSWKSRSLAAMRVRR